MIFVQVSLLWIPYIIFRNTDSDEAVAVDSTRTVISITRQGDFVRSGPEIADEVNEMMEKKLYNNYMVHYFRLRSSKEKRI